MFAVSLLPSIRQGPGRVGLFTSLLFEPTSRLAKCSNSHVIGIFMAIHGYLRLLRVKVSVRVTSIS